MKRLVTLLLLVATPLLAEEITIKQSAMLKADRNLVSLKPGTVVELISRDGADVTIRYKNLTGKIPASKLVEAEVSAAAEKPAGPAPARTTPAAKPKKAEKKPAEASRSESKPANPPQTIYGKAVQKAKDSAAAHDKNVVKPTDEVLKDR